AASCVVRDHRKADGGRLHQGRYRGMGGACCPLHPRLRRTARHEAAQCLRLRSLYRWSRPALRRGAARADHYPGVRRHDPAAGSAHPPFFTPPPHPTPPPPHPPPSPPPPPPP